MIDITTRVYRENTQVLSNRTQYIIIFLVILIMANCLKVITDEFILGLFLFCFSLFLIKREKIDIIIPYIIGTWIVINIISYGFNRTSFSTWTFIGFIVKMLYPYFILKLIGETFFEKLEKIVFALASISLPLFVIQISAPNIMNIMIPISTSIISDEMLSDGGWYGIIFRVNGCALYRNSGFMWEPGAFAFMLLLALSYRIIKSGLKLDLKNIIYVLALITTFSTMAYLGIAILLIAFIISSKKTGIILLIVPIVIFYIGFVTNLNFMLPKVQGDFSTLGLTYTPEGKTYLKVNRLAYIIFSFQQSLAWPFGYGIVPSKYVHNEYHGTLLEGVGTIAKILFYWGWGGLLFLISAFYKFYACFLNKSDRMLIMFAITILVIAFFSNPLEKSPMLYSIVFYPFIFNKLPVKK